MSLALSSDTLPLERFVKALEVEVKHLYFKGRAMADTGVLAGRPAKAHQASVANAEGKTPDDVNAWLRDLCENITSERELPALLRSGSIRALFWIALFGPDVIASPTPDQNIVETVARLNSRILFENYSILGDDGCPTKTWYPSDA